LQFNYINMNQTKIADKQQEKVWGKRKRKRAGVHSAVNFFGFGRILACLPPLEYGQIMSVVEGESNQVLRKPLMHMFLGMISFCFSFLSVSGQVLPYKNAKLPVEKRVMDLLGRMTLEEKVAQLQSTHAGRPKLTDDLFLNTKKLDSMYANGVGMINPAFDETMEQTIERRNRLQQYLKTKTRLGIPVIFIDEAHHGLVQRNVDVFPHGIGLAASWDTALLTKIYDYIAQQASSRGTSLVLSPVVDVTRDPRWGRTGETYGEDPFLCGVLGSAVVKGFQGSSTGRIAPNHVAATLKHFAGHGQPESGNNTGPANYSVRALREFHMEPFRYIVRKANPAGIMAAYCELGELPAHANKWLLTDVLKKEWNYKGIVVSDWFGIDQIMAKHQFASDLKEAALKAFNAGVTIDLPYGINYVHLIQLVKDGKISMKAIDEAVAPILRLKFQMGLFERPVIDVNEALKFNQKTEGRALALKIAEESMILLKNEKNLLPIKKDQYKKIAVVGPFGAINLLGDYSGVPLKNVSLLQGIKNKVGGQAEVMFAQGCRISLNGDSISQNNYQFIDSIKFPSKEENLRLIEEAVETARNADFVVLALGENEQFSREAWNKHPGDMIDLNLQGQQEELVKAIAATGKPYVVYLMHGRPLTINWIAANAPAIVDGWFCGEEAGNAFANILFGDVNPSGKLTISIPRSIGQIPVFYNAKPTSRFYDYVTEKNTVLYAFGYGLSYTTFGYGGLALSAPAMGKNGSVTAQVTVSNTGTMKGDEVVQLYIRQKSGSSVVRPIKELKGFQRVTLNAGEIKTVSFKITPELLKHWTADMKFEVEPGVYEVMIGRNSGEVEKVEFGVK
jgi:beta-glucosidase